MMTRLASAVTALIDTHCHLDSQEFDEDRDEVVARAEAAGVSHIVVPALDLTGASKVIALSERYRGGPAAVGIHAAVGVHPNSAAGWEMAWLTPLRELAANPSVVAIGEIGLDYYRDFCPPETQRIAFHQQLALAAELELPVIIHNRESDVDLLRLLAESPLNGLDAPGVLHSFSTTWEVASQALAMGFYLGFTGPVTYPKALALRDVVSRAPLERLLVETDAPYLAPQRYRGRRNEPAYVLHVASRVAEIRGMELEALAAQTSANARRLFGPRLSDSAAASD